MLKNNISNSPWTKDEENLLKDMVEEKGKKAWQDISKELYKASNNKIFRSAK